MEKLLQKNYYLHQSAKDGFRAYLQSYASYSLKKIYNINSLDLSKVGKAFGFAVPPRINIAMGEGGSRAASGTKRRPVSIKYSVYFAVEETDDIVVC